MFLQALLCHIVYPEYLGSPQKEPEAVSVSTVRNQVCRSEGPRGGDPSRLHSLSCHGNGSRRQQIGPRGTADRFRSLRLPELCLDSVAPSASELKAHKV